MSADHGGCADMTIKVAGRTVGRRFGRVSRPFSVRRAHSCQAPRQTLADHPQIGQRKQRLQLRRVLGQAAIAHLHMPELALDDSERMLHLGADADLHMLELVEHGTHGAALVQRAALGLALVSALA